MQHEEYRVKLLNDQGQLVGHKLRKEVDKRQDILHCADVLVFQGEQLLLSKIPATTLYGDCWGATTATMIREGEASEDAARRALQKELGIKDAQLILLGERFFVYPDGVKRLKSTFWCRVESAPEPNPEDIEELRTFNQMETQVLMEDSESVAPTLLGIWQTYRDKLPL